jgi:hypothetical protein
MGALVATLSVSIPQSAASAEYPPAAAPRVALSAIRRTIPSRGFGARRMPGGFSRLVGVSPLVAGTARSARCARAHPRGEPNSRN